MLQSLSSKKYGQYRFIDKVENTGLVCGEIAHHLLYVAVRDAEIRLESGEMYDWKTNQWLQTVQIGDLSGDTERTFHVRTTQPRKIMGEFWGIPVMSFPIEEAIQELKAILLDTIFPPALRPVLLDTVRTLPYDLDKCRDGNPVEYENAYIDLTRYMFRQRTQELLYETRIYNKNMLGIYQYQDQEQYEKALKMKLRTFFDMLKTYINANQTLLSTDDKTFMKVLQDDIYIAHQTMGKADADMFCTSRQQSQGNQTAYAVTNIRLRPGNFPSIGRERSPSLSSLGGRQNSIGMTPLSRTSTSMYEFDDLDGLSDASTVRLYDDVDGTSSTDTFDDYLLSQNTETTYSTPGITRMMRDVSMS
jgi:hypothetical protein